jgi:hypothetical protein
MLLRSQSFILFPLPAPNSLASISLWQEQIYMSVKYNPLVIISHIRTTIETILQGKKIETDYQIYNFNESYVYT